MRHQILAFLAALFFVQSAIALTPPRRIVLIVMENSDYSSIIGSAQAPYINQLAKKYALATNYFSQRHPSLPNYLDLVGGTGYGIKDDNETYVLSGEFIGRQLREAGYTAAQFAESLPL